MKARFVPLALIATLLLTFGALAAACGGDGGGALTLQEYFQEVDALFDNTAEQSNALGEEPFADLDALEEQIEASRSFYFGFAAITATFRDAMRDIDPPAEVEDAHNALVEAADDFAQATGDINNKLDEVASQADFVAVFAAFAELGNPEEACFALQGIAEENGIDVSLNCALE